MGPRLTARTGVDAWGPGTRIPALVIARSLKHSGVDHTTYDTTSILATIEHSYGLPALSSRDASVNDLTQRRRGRRSLTRHPGLDRPGPTIGAAPRR